MVYANYRPAVYIFSVSSGLARGKRAVFMEIYPLIAWTGSFLKLNGFPAGLLTLNTT